MLITSPAWGLWPQAHLAIMILPIISSLTREVMTAVPNSQAGGGAGSGGDALGDDSRGRAEECAGNGIVGAIILGLGRALGETMAVTMVIGNSPEIQLEPAQQAGILTAPQFNT